MYIWQSGAMPPETELEEIITLNQFYQLPHINKILIFQGKKEGHAISSPLQDFCLKHSVRIQFLEEYTVPKLIEGIYYNSKGQVLLHEYVGNDQTIYDLPTPAEKLRK